MWSIPALRALRVALFGIVFKLPGICEFIPRGKFTDPQISLGSRMLSTRDLPEADCRSTLVRFLTCFIEEAYLVGVPTNRRINI